MRTLRRLLLTLFICGLLFIPVSKASAFSGPGSGTEANPYLISTADQLNEVRDELAAHYKLVNNIDLSGYPSWVPIGIVDGQVAAGFNGYFDGKCNKILNLKIVELGGGTPGRNGLFGWTNTGSNISNLVLENIDIEYTEAEVSNEPTGGLVAYNYGTVTNCYVTGKIIFRANSIGGLIGFNHGKITDCHSEVNVAGGSTVGGLIGHNRGEVINCYATGNVSKTGTSASSCYGGLIGYNHKESKITSCYATGNVTGAQSTGGLVGDNAGIIENCYSTGDVTDPRKQIGGLVGYQRDTGVLKNCYSAGSVTGTDNCADGLIGYNNGTTINCYWDMNTSGQSSSSGSGEGKTTVEMKKQITFVDWDFTTTWDMVNDKTYPWLRMLPTPDAPGFEYTHVTEVTLNPKTITLNLDSEETKTVTLTATISPEDASNKNVTWSSSNTSIATVSSSGVVTAVAQGSATITVTTEDGGKTATCSVTVNSGAQFPEEIIYIVPANMNFTIYMLGEFSGIDTWTVPGDSNTYTNKVTVTPSIGQGYTAITGFFDSPGLKYGSIGTDGIKVNFYVVPAPTTQHTARGRFIN